MTEETWLEDFRTTPGCATIKPDLLYGCWVETGVVAFGGASHYFSADARPSTTYWYINTPNINPSESNQYLVAYLIQTSSSSYAIYLSLLNSDGTLTPKIQDISSSNTMSPDTIDAGIENAGGTGTAENGSWTNNVWVDMYYTGHYQTDDGVGAPPSNPPFGYWYYHPAQSTTGGAWVANSGV